MAEQKFNVPSRHNIKKGSRKIVQNKDRGVLSARVLMNLEWRQESGPEIKCSRCPADQMMGAGVLLITYISKHRLPEQSHFPHEWHVQDQRWNNKTTTTQRGHKQQTHNCDSDTTPRQPSTGGGKKEKKEWKWNPSPQSKCRWRRKVVGI